MRESTAKSSKLGRSTRKNNARQWPDRSAVVCEPSRGGGENAVRRSRCLLGVHAQRRAGVCCPRNLVAGKLIAQVIMFLKLDLLSEDEVKKASDNEGVALRSKQRKCLLNKKKENQEGISR